MNLLEAKAKYPPTYTGSGQIVQWDTHESYTYYPTQQEVEQLLKEYGEKAGLYTLSQTAKAAIHKRLRQMRDTYLRRLAYERKMGLNIDGSRQ